MSDYAKTTNFAAKDALASGNAGKIVKGSELDTEFNNIATHVATKANIASPAFTGTPTAPTASAGTSTTQLATTAFVTTTLPAADNTWAGAQTFRDNKFAITGSADTTKILNVEVDGLTTATTRTLTIPDKSGTVALTSDLSVIPLSTTNNTIVSGTYGASASTTITITATNTFSAGQDVYVTFTNSSGSALTADKFTIVTATSSNFTITYGSSVTSAGTATAERYGAIAVANAADMAAGTSEIKAVTPKQFRDNKLVSATAVTASTTAVEFASIPSWVKRITIMFSDLSTNAANPLYLQIASSSTYDTTGYYANCIRIVNDANPGTTNISNGLGFILDAGTQDDASVTRTGVITLSKLSGNTWVCNGSYILPTINRNMILTGTKTLSATLDRVRLIANSTLANLFDNGTVNIMYE